MTIFSRSTFRGLLGKVLLIVIGAVLLMPFVEHVSAQISIPIPGSGQLSQDLPTIEDAIGSVDGLTSLQIVQNLAFRLIRMVLIIIQALIIFYFAFIGMLMVTSTDNEDALKKHQQNLIFSTIGFIVLSLGDNVIEVFNPVMLGADGKTVVKSAAQATDITAIYNLQAWQGQIMLLVDIIRYALWTVAIVLIVITGVRMFFSKDRDTSKERKSLLWLGIGLFVVQLGHFFIEPVIGQFAYNVDQTTGTLTVTEGVVSTADRLRQGNQTLLNVANIILTFFAPMSFFGVVMGAFYMITARGDQEKVTRAKQIIIGSAIAFVIALSSYTLVSEVARNVARI